MDDSRVAAGVVMAGVLLAVVVMLSRAKAQHPDTAIISGAQVTLS